MKDRQEEEEKEIWLFEFDLEIVSDDLIREQIEYQG